MHSTLPGELRLIMHSTVTKLGEFRVWGLVWALLACSDGFLIGLCAVYEQPLPRLASAKPTRLTNAVCMLPAGRSVCYLMLQDMSHNRFSP